jgi:hypothetical protein
MRVAITPGIHILTMSSGFPRIWARLLCYLVSFLLLCSISALAHDHHGPPARIITDEQVGPWTISVWVQQSMETGRIFVKVRPSSGATVPDDLQVEIGIQPTGQNSSVTFYLASRESPDGQYGVDAPFNMEQSWQVRVRLQSSGGVNETAAYIGASPPGSGQWQLLLYSLPFLSVGGLWLRVYWVRENIKRRLALTHFVAN